MKTLRILVTLLSTIVSLAFPRTVLAGTNVTVISQDPNDRKGSGDLRGVPANVRTLVSSFDQQRDQYLKQQRLLQTKLNQASNAQERQSIRDQLQANRQEFLADLKTFRQELRNDLKALDGKVSHAEFQRLLDAANGAGNGGGNHHRGH